jgi:hypothetical protein
LVDSCAVLPHEFGGHREFCPSASRAKLGPMTTREQAQKLLDELPEDELGPIVEILASRGKDPVLRLLDDAPEEDEEISTEEEAAVQEARDEIAAGVPLIPFDEIKREFGYDSK